MIILYLSSLFLFAWNGFDLGAGHFHHSASTSSSNLSSQTASGIRSSSCSKGKVKAELPDGDSVCHNECLALKAEIETIYNMYPSYRSTDYLYNTCGAVTKGICGAGTDASFPSCWCTASSTESNIQRKMSLLNCRSSLQLIRTFMNARATAANDFMTESTKKRTSTMELRQEAELEAVAMHQFPPSRPVTRAPSRPSSQPLNPFAPSFYPNLGNRPPVGSVTGPSVRPPSLSQQQQEDFNSKPDNEQEGGILVTDVRISGKDVRAMLDTGAEFTMVHHNFAAGVVRFNWTGLGASSQAFQIFGKTTIHVEIRDGIYIPITGLVTDRKYQLLLGNDFFLAYATKLQIRDRTMELFVSQTTVQMTMKFRADPVAVNMMRTNYYPAYSALQIFARMNGVDIKMVIDTGSTINLANINSVNERTLRKVGLRCSYGGSSSVGFLGGTDVNLMIGSQTLKVFAFVPEFVPPFAFLTGNDFNRRYVEIIDYKTTSVTLIIPTSTGYNRFVTPAFVNQRVEGL